MGKLGLAVATASAPEVVDFVPSDSSRLSRFDRKSSASSALVFLFLGGMVVWVRRRKTTSATIKRCFTLRLNSWETMASLRVETR